MSNKVDDEKHVWVLTDRSRPPPQRTFARNMRKAPTEAERKLWWHLRHRLELRGTHFRRQVQIGPYIADFANHKLGLIIEIDGGQHALNASDLVRTRRLETDGYRVLRFWNNDVLSNIDGVLTEIQTAIASTPPPPPTLPTRGRGEGIGDRRPSPSRGG